MKHENPRRRYELSECLLVIINLLLLSFGIAKGDNAAYWTDVTASWSVCMCVCLSHSRTLLKPLNGVQLGRDTCAVPGKTVLDRGFGSPRKGEIREVGTPVRSDASYRPITLAIIIFYALGSKGSRGLKIKFKK